MGLNNFSLEEKFGLKLIDKWENKYPVFRNKDVRDWIRNKLEKYIRNGKDFRKFNITIYLKNFNDFCEYYELINPSELLKEDIDTRNSRVIQYLSYLIQKGSNEVTVRNAIQSRIRSFYSDRGSPTSDGLSIRRSGDNQNEIILDKDIIRKIQVKLERPEYRLLLKLIAGTGLRISDILDTLKSSKYKFQKYKEHYFLRNFKTKKSGVIINYLFFSKELSVFIRDIYGVELDDLDLSIILKTNRDTDIRGVDFLGRLKDVVKELNIRENIKIHSFRKFFNTVIIRRSDLDVEFKEHLMGHSIGLASSYNNNLRDIDFFYESWKKIEPSISIDTKLQDVTSQSVSKLEEENLNLKRQIEILLESKFRLEDKINKMEKTVDIISDENKFRDFVLSAIKKDPVKIKF